MDIKGRLLKEHSKRLTVTIVKYVGDDSNRFKQLLDALFSNDKLLAQRAAWPFSFCALNHPHLINKYYSKLIRMLNEPVHHTAVHRNILRVFQNTELPEKYYGDLIDIAFKNIKDTKQPLAVRAFSITLACNMCQKYPELKNELSLILGGLMEQQQAPAIRVRVKRAIKELVLDK